MKKIEIIGKELSNMNKRRCFNDAVNFLDKSKGVSGRILSLYGLRRTGKTVLMRQLALKYDIPHIYEVEPKDTMDDVKEVLDKEVGRSKIVFIDEITNANDFIEESAILADYYASIGLDVVIAGTDSLGLYLAEDDELLDRTYRVNMTYISFAEHCEVLGVDTLDEYIEYGGLMKRGMLDNEAIKDYNSARKYLDSAVANNISSSISKTIMSPRYADLERYTKKDLFLAIEKLVEVYNGVFSDKIINKTVFKPIIGMPIKYQMKKLVGKDDIIRYGKINLNELRKEYADIINLTCKLSKPATVEMVDMLDDVLTKINLLSRVETYHFGNTDGAWELSYRQVEKYVIQPAIKYHQLKEASRLLLESECLDMLSPIERVSLKKQLTNDIYGKITENIVLYDTRRCLDYDDFSVCKTYFEGEINGEYDMLIYDCNNDCHYAFEVKHSNKAVVGYNEQGDYVGQDKHLLKDDIKRGIADNFGICKGNFVLYNGEGLVSPRETYYVNISDFLKSLDDTHDIEMTIRELTLNLQIKKETDLIDENPNIYPFPVRMDNIPLECQSDLHRLILLHSGEFASKTIHEKMEKKYPMLMGNIDKQDIKILLDKYKALPSYKSLSAQFKKTAQGRNFENNFFQPCSKS